MSHGGGSSERWVISYADLVTLLFAVFVVLFAVSNVDSKKASTVEDAIQAAFTKPLFQQIVPLPGQAPTSPLRAPDRPPPRATGVAPTAQGEAEAKSGSQEPSKEDALREAAEVASTFRAAEGIAKNQGISDALIHIGHTDQKVELMLDERLLFPEGGTELLPTAWPVLDEVARALTACDCRAEFVGHTDSSKPSGWYRSNWEVGAARALAVLTYVEQAGPVDGRKLKASTRGEYQPRSGGDDAGARARDRRVEIVVTMGDGG